MIGEITNHLWQSTGFAIAVTLVALAFRKNRAEVRYWLWLSASLKFLVPFSLLIGVGMRVWDALPAGKIATHIGTIAVSQTMVEITQPFPESFAQISSAHHVNNWIPVAIFTLWAFGFFCAAIMRTRSWFRIRAAVRASAPIAIDAAIPVRSSTTLLEPGIVGFLNPFLLLPQGILNKLTPPQLEAVLAHEQCHIRRRDNLTSAFHMLVEALCWFHPIVWWIGAKLVEERERACDEAVLKLGSEPQIYAEGILNVCKSYLESPLRCVSGVTSSDLKRRIRAILSQNISHDLTFGRKAALVATAIAAVGAPILVGMIGAPSIHAQALSDYKFEVASIKPGQKLLVGGSYPFAMRFTPDGFIAQNATLRQLIEQAYRPASGTLWDEQVSGQPDWYKSEGYSIDAKIDESVANALKNLSPDQLRLAQQHMLQVLLIDRFKLTAHHETRELPAYLLSVVKPGKLVSDGGNCGPDDNPPMPEDPSKWPLTRCGSIISYPGHLGGRKVTIAQLASRLPSILREGIVVDKTGLAGKFDIILNWTPDADDPTGFGGTPAPDPNGPPLLAAIQQQLGLKLEHGKGPVDVVVIDHVERPSGN
jgi:bla regulator protein BlaR1